MHTKQNDPEYALVFHVQTPEYNHMCVARCHITHLSTMEPSKYYCCLNTMREMGVDATKPVLGVSSGFPTERHSNQVPQLLRLAKKLNIGLYQASLYMILSNKQMTKAQIRLYGCAGWSAPLLFTNHRRQIFSHQGPYYPSKYNGTFQILLLF